MYDPFSPSSSNPMNVTSSSSNNNVTSNVSKDRAYVTTPPSSTSMMMPAPASLVRRHSTGSSASCGPPGLTLRSPRSFPTFSNLEMSGSMNPPESPMAAAGSAFRTRSPTPTTTMMKPMPTTSSIGSLTSIPSVSDPSLAQLALSLAGDSVLSQPSNSLDLGGHPTMVGSPLADLDGWSLSIAMASGGDAPFRCCDPSLGHIATPPTASTPIANERGARVWSDIVSPENSLGPERVPIEPQPASTNATATNGSASSTPNVVERPLTEKQPPPPPPPPPMAMWQYLSPDSSPQVLSLPRCPSSDL